jgi:hypothetical protein
MKKIQETIGGFARNKRSGEGYIQIPVCTLVCPGLSIGADKAYHVQSVTHGDGVCCQGMKLLDELIVAIFQPRAGLEFLPLTVLAFQAPISVGRPAHPILTCSSLGFDVR